MQMMVRMLAFCWMASLGVLQFLPLPVAANEPIDSICQSSSEYLDAMYRCRPNEFHVISFCASSGPHELACNRSKRIAVLSASVGPSLNNQCSHSQTVASAVLGERQGASDGECCVLSAVEAKCKGKMKCSLSNDLQQTVDGSQCALPSSRRQQRTQLINVVFICVSPKMLRDINRDKSNPDAFCDDQSEPNTDEVPPSPTDNHRLIQQLADISKHTGQLITTSATQRFESTNSAGLTSSDVSESSPRGIVSPAMLRRTGMVDWIWSFIYIKENMDRFLIYLFLSIAIGIICVLVIIILGLCFGHRFSNRKRSSDDVIHRKQSSTQTTTDVTSALIASNRSPGVEMVRYVHTDSIRSQPLTRSSGATSTPPTAGGNMVHFATDGSSTDGLGSTASFRGNGGTSGVHHGLNLPQYQINAASGDSVDDGGVGAMGRGGRAGEGSDEYRSSTLGRFYSNPYRHDSYRADGYRTLQHK